jgi:hypothetical protein
VSAPRRQGPEPPPHLTCPITNEVCVCVSGPRVA